VRSGDIAN
ncbi:fecCD transport family protein, partial [Escherichia coli 8.2524]